MAFPADRTFLIGSVLQWWDKHAAKRDARRTARLEKRTSRRRSRAEADKKDPAPQADTR